MRDLVADQLGGNRVVVRLWPHHVGAAQNFGQRVQPLHHLLGRDTVINQAGDLGHPDFLEAFNAGDAILHGSEQTGILKIAMEGEIEDRFHLLAGKRCQIDLHRVFDTGGFFERGEGPGALFDQPCGRAQIILHRFTRHIPRQFTVARNIGVQHQGDGEISGVVARLAQRVVVGLYPFANILDGLPQKMGQYIGADFTGLAPGRRIARDRHPDRQLF